MLTFTNNEEINQTEEELEPNKIKAQTEQGRKQNRSRYQAKQNFSHTNLTLAIIFLILGY